MTRAQIAILVLFVGTASLAVIGYTYCVRKPPQLESTNAAVRERLPKLKALADEMMRYQDLRAVQFEGEFGLRTSPAGFGGSASSWTQSAQRMQNLMNETKIYGVDRSTEVVSFFLGVAARCFEVYTMRVRYTVDKSSTVDQKIPECQRLPIFVNQETQCLDRIDRQWVIHYDWSESP